MGRGRSLVVRTHNLGAVNHLSQWWWQEGHPTLIRSQVLTCLPVSQGANSMGLVTRSINWSQLHRCRYNLAIQRPLPCTAIGKEITFHLPYCSTIRFIGPKSDHKPIKNWVWLHTTNSRNMDNWHVLSSLTSLCVGGVTDLFRHRWL